MKFFKKLLLILLVALLILGVGYQGLRYIRRPDYDLLTKVELHSIHGMALGITTYKMELVDGTWVASCEEDAWREETSSGQKQLSIYAASELKDLVGDLLEGRPVWKWPLKEKIEDKINSVIPDLPSYRYCAVFSDGSVIEGSRYGDHPYGFSPLWNALKELLGTE